MPDYKLLRTWVKFTGKSKAETWDYLTPLGQQRTRTLLDTADQGRKTEDGYVYCFHLRFSPDQFADGKIPQELSELAEIAHRMVLEDYVAKPKKVVEQFSDIVPGQYIDQGKVIP